jgi:glycosyltransferase involved in cell wall biosynthesis
MDLLAVIPAYNEEKKIGAVVRETLTYCDVLVIDDGSVDATGKTAREHGAIVLTHEINRGKGAALRTGFGYACTKEYDAVITLDADGQHDPAEIPRFLEKAERYDIVIGKREFGKMPPLRQISNTITSALLSLRVGQYIGDSQSGYRLIKTVVLKDLHLKTERFAFESELLVRANCSIGNVPIQTIYADEKSHVRNVSDTITFIKFFVKSLYDEKD